MLYNLIATFFSANRLSKVGFDEFIEIRRFSDDDQFGPFG